eukprot:CAMPEP_0180712162 /NCGR_PEP_ID=MMETSP1038_2-20121128/11230_1 /TAXON_ID=632150 /ORGANISM="Azadinium spinosum, Strain 3D9" /LENGTH=94 /DNA_ID=CAMNT_0022744419 /DNA_START=605 /DNA_END=886 /DNA_ORIENTATION=-
MSAAGMKNKALQSGSHADPIPCEARVSAREDDRSANPQLLGYVRPRLASVGTPMQAALDCMQQHDAPISAKPVDVGNRAVKEDLRAHMDFLLAR